MSYSRRKFIRTALGTCAGLTVGAPLTSLTGCAANLNLRTNRTFKSVLADLHVHTSINDWNSNSALGVRFPDVANFAKDYFNVTGMDWEKCYETGIDIICSAHFNAFDEWVTMPTDSNPEAPHNTIRMMDRLEEELEGEAGQYAKILKNYKELTDHLQIPKNDDRYRVGVIHTVEGGHALGGNPKALEMFAKRGTALMTVTHFFNKGIASAANSFPFFPDAGARWPHDGLSGFGREVLDEMKRLKMLVDVTHATPTSVRDIIEYTNEPLVASHASVQTLADHPYSLYDEHIKEIVKNDGIIGVIIYPYIMSNYINIHEADVHGTLRDVVRTIRYLVKLCGDHKNIGIGSDFAGYITGPSDMRRLENIWKLRKMLMDEFGEDNESMVNDILANNVINFLKKNWRTGL